MELSQDQILEIGKYATIERQSLYDATHWIYAAQQLWVLGTELKKQERILNHLLKLYWAQRKFSWIPHKD